MFYNTTNETGETLKESKAKAITQNELIIHVFNTWREQNGLTPSELNKILIEHWDTNWPITSIRRALTTLTDDGNLVKTNDLRKGVYGKKEHVWKIKTKTIS